MSQEFDLSEILKRLEKVEHKLGIYYIPNADVVLEELFLSTDVRTLQQILREVDAPDLALVMIGFKSETLLQLKNAMSKTGWGMILEDVACCLSKGVFVHAVKEARMRVLTAVNRLRDIGEIVFPIDLKEFNVEDWKKQMADMNAKFSEKVEGVDSWKKDVFDILKNG